MSGRGSNLHSGGYVIRGSRRRSVPDAPLDPRGYEFGAPDDTGGHSGNGTGRHNWGAQEDPSSSTVR